jgi:hypothetical protein
MQPPGAQAATTAGSLTRDMTYLGARHPTVQAQPWGNFQKSLSTGGGILGRVRQFGGVTVARGKKI